MRASFFLWSEVEFFLKILFSCWGFFSIEISVFFFAYTLVLLGNFLVLWRWRWSKVMRWNDWTGLVLIKSRHDTTRCQLFVSGGYPPVGRPSPFLQILQSLTLTQGRARNVSSSHPSQVPSTKRTSSSFSWFLFLVRSGKSGKVMGSGPTYELMEYESGNLRSSGTPCQDVPARS